jgi:hypothetical protein
LRPEEEDGHDDEEDQRDEETKERQTLGDLRGRTRGPFGVTSSKGRLVMI